MSYRRGDREIPNWIKYVGLIVLALACVAMVAYALSGPTAPIQAPSLYSPKR